jgi:hypothetical protein
MKNIGRSWIFRKIVAEAEGGPVKCDDSQFVRYYIVTVIAYTYVFKIQCVNIYWLNSFDNHLLFIRNICNCFLVIQGFSVRHFASLAIASN